MRAAKQTRKKRGRGPKANRAPLRSDFPLANAVIVRELGPEEIAQAPARARYEHESPELHRKLTWLSNLGRDPEKILDRELEDVFARQKKVGPRLESLMEAERERRRMGRKARGPTNETHRKNLRKALSLLFPDAAIRKFIIDMFLENNIR
jgi:hypothetical protein